MKRTSKAKPGLLTILRDNISAADARLIANCVEICAAFSASAGGFKADPTGSMIFASPAGSRHMERMRAKLQTVIATPAKTHHALSAKARLVGPILEDAEGTLENEAGLFLLGFAADVQLFCDDTIDKAWKAAREAKTNGDV